MTTRLISIAIDSEQDVVSVRQRSRQIAASLGLESQEQVRVATAVSEIARNAFRYARRGLAEFLLETQGSRQYLVVRISDQGPGIADLPSVLSGSYRSQTGMGLGIVGAQRLMDDFDIRSSQKGGTTVVMKKRLSAGGRHIDRAEIGRITATLTSKPTTTPLQEVQEQNRELVRTLHELRDRQDELVRLNQELADTNRGVVALYAELDEKADHLRSADEMKSRFLSNMSHEFRTPLNSIRALVRLLLDRTDGPLTSEQEKQVLFVQKSAEDLAQLVDDLLDLAKIEAGKIEIQPVEFSVANLFSALRGMLRPLLVTDSVHLRFEDTEGIPLLFTDEAKTSQILRNFISNALKFTERGEVRVRAQYEERNDTVTFSVIDTGIGIAKEDQAKIFEEFVQVRGPHQRKVKGTGLGLPLCRRLAFLLGGSVGVESEVGIGSTFFATIPIRLRSPESDALTGRREPDDQRPRILVVEDDEHTQLVYDKTFRDSKYSVMQARNLRQAKQALEERRPAAIILDIKLEGEFAWQWLHELKQQPSTQSIPVIVVSATGDSRKAMALGADSYIEQPFDPADLFQRLDSHASRRVLVVDDDAAFRYTVRKALASARIEVVEAENGESGLQSAQSVLPKVIILDLGLPDIDGAVVLDRLRESGSTRNIPVVIATSRELEPAMRTHLLTKARQVIGKNAWQASLVSEVQRILAEGDC